MKTLISILLISLIAACPLIFSSCNSNSTPEEEILDEQLAETTLTVSGLHCQSCKTKLEGELLDHGMKAQVDVKKMYSNTVVRHNKNVSLADIKKIIVAAGYKVEN